MSVVCLYIGCSYPSFECIQPGRDIAESSAQLGFVERFRGYLAPVAAYAEALLLVERDRLSVEADYCRRQEFPPGRTVVPPYPFAGIRCSIVEIPDCKIGQMIRHLGCVSSLSPSHPSSAATVDECCPRLCRMCLEACIVSPGVPPEHCPYAFLGYSGRVVLSCRCDG